MRKRLATLAVAMSIASGCAADGADESTPSEPVTAEDVAASSPTSIRDDMSGAADTVTVPDDPTDERIAQMALLNLDDFPTGWTEAPVDDAGDDDADAGPGYAECVGGEGDQILGTETGRAESSEFTSPDGGSISQMVMLAPDDEAEEFMIRFGASGVDDCVAGTVRDRLDRGLAGDPTAPEAMSIGEVTVGRLELAPAGDELLAYRVTIPVTANETEFELYVDLVAARIGRGVTGFSVFAAVSPFPARELERYIGLATDRLAEALTA